MKRTKLAFLALTAVVFFAAPTQTSHAQLRQIQLRVDGLACPFCAYGLEKNVKAIKGVDKIKIDMDKGVVTLFPKEGESIPIDRLRKAVKDGGFTPRELNLVVAGQISTLATLTDDKDAMKAIAEILKAAKDQGLKLPENPFVLKLENPNQIFLLLKSPDKAHRKSFEQLSSLTDNHQAIVVTGTIPVPTKKKKMVSTALFVKSLNVENSG
ncbi:cation transporter [Candidatus Poribacteria bacterium]|nr:cation transporter [Candidatus Poribacteria bacterium]